VSVDIVMTDQNTVYARKSNGLKQFEWAGSCSRLDRIVQEKGAMNPTYCQGINGGIRTSGHTNGVPGLATTTFMFKESVNTEELGDEMRNCDWDIDRRSHCEALPMWNSWLKIERLVTGRATSEDDVGSTMNEDSEEGITSLPWSAEDKCIIRRVALTVSEFGGGS
jgi:hypothetical protein